MRGSSWRNVFRALQGMTVRPVDGCGTQQEAGWWLVAVGCKGAGGDFPPYLPVYPCCFAGVPGPGGGVSAHRWGMTVLPTVLFSWCRAEPLHCVPSRMLRHWTVWGRLRRSA